MCLPCNRSLTKFGLCKREWMDVDITQKAKHFYGYSSRSNPYLPYLVLSAKVTDKGPVPPTRTGRLLFLTVPGGVSREVCVMILTSPLGVRYQQPNPTEK